MDMILVAMIVVMGVAMIFPLLVWAKQYQRVPPNTAMVVFGKSVPPIAAQRAGAGTNANGSRKQTKMCFTFLVGGGKFIFPVVEDYRIIDLSAHSVERRVERVRFATAGDLTAPPPRRTVAIKGVVHIPPEDRMLNTAAVNLLDASEAAICDLAGTILENQTRAAAAAASSSVEARNMFPYDEQALAAAVRERAAPELAAIGLEIVSFNLTID